MDGKLIKTQLTEIVQSGVFIGNMIGKLGKEILTKYAVPLAQNVLPQLADNATSSVIDKLEKKRRGQGAIRAGKRFTLFILNEDMDDILRIVESLENSGLLIDSVNKNISGEIKKKKLLGSMFGKGVSKREKETRRWYSSVLASTMFKTIFGKGVMAAGAGVLRARRGYKNIDHIKKF